MESHSVRVQVTASFIAKARLAIIAVRTCARLESLVFARVGCQSISHVVSFPDVHLSTASALTAEVCRALHPLNVVRTLGVTIASTIGSPGIITRMRFTAISFHFYEVEGAINPTR